MPVKVKRKGHCYSVRTPNGVKGRCTSKRKAEAQSRLLNAIDNGWQPSRSRGRKM